MIKANRIEVVNMSRIVFELLKKKTICGLEPSMDALDVEEIEESILLPASKFSDSYYKPDSDDFFDISKRILDEDKFNEVVLIDDKLFFTYNWSQPTKLYNLVDIPNMILYFMDMYIVEKSKEKNHISAIPKCFEPSLEGSNITLTDKPSINERKKEQVTKISAFLLGELMNKYIDYNISIGNWPRQCTNIHEFIFEKDLGKQINLTGTKEKFIEVYRNCINVITDLIENSDSFEISNDPSSIGPYNIFLKIINPFPELVIYRYKPSERTSSSLSITVDGNDIDIKHIHNKDVFAKEYYEFQKQLKQNKKCRY